MELNNEKLMFLGLALAGCCIGNAHINYRKLHDKYGPIVRTAPNVVDISDPAVIPSIYAIGSKFVKSAFYNTLAVIHDDKLMHSLFSTMDPEEHKALKRPVAQKFSMTSIRTLEYLVDPCSEMFITSMQELEGQVIDLGAWVQWYAFDVIGAITFSRRFGFMKNRKDVNDVIHGIETGLWYAGLVGQVPSLHWGLLGNITFRRFLAKVLPGFKDPITIVTDMVLEQIEDYDSKAPAADRADFLAYFRKQQLSTGVQMGTRELMNHLMNNLLAGSDTTAISLRAVFYYIIQDKRVYQTLQREIDEAHKLGKLSPVITYAESLQLEYLQLCMKEALRMHPGVSYPLERVVPQGGTNLCGTHLPAGTVVGVNAAVIHRNRDIFGDDADQFRPERWICDEEKIKQMDRNLLTFGAGARTCIGKNISIMEVGKFVPQILRAFDLEWASSKPEWQVKTYWFAKQTGLLVRFKSRPQIGQEECVGEKIREG
ncbi:cytochrome P450 [Ilyonectria robusta]|uniref:cytochrome P450 n=1 Tax=Ilyonectria robusta TaxID=1079257 RepID=UPI001E8D7962|nr:cytochrome P450 [Ilyonectria robusta]KAH8683619.1 cytochrome P450 [Ilyonectria robusta]